MKQYSVYFNEPVAHTYKDERFNKETRKWEEVEVTEMVKSVTFYSLAPAKKLIKANLENMQVLASQRRGQVGIGRTLEKSTSRGQTRHL